MGIYDKLYTNSMIPIGIMVVAVIILLFNLI